MSDEIKASPKIGDRVRVTVPCGKWTAHEGEVVNIRRDALIDVDLDYEVVTFTAIELEVIDPAPVVRIEGYPMEFNDVKIGDTVETVSTYRDQGVNVRVSRQGVVGQIDTRDRVIRTRGGVLLGDMKMEDGTVAINLVKSMENDQVFMALGGLPAESIISYRRRDGGLSVAAQVDVGTWQLTNSTKSLKTLTLREMIRNATDGGDEFQVIHRGTP
jgi:hypothetical protein